MSTIYDYKKTRAVVIERPYEVRLREITLRSQKGCLYRTDVLQQYFQRNGYEDL